MVNDEEAEGQLWFLARRRPLQIGYVNFVGAMQNGQRLTSSANNKTLVLLSDSLPCPSTVIIIIS